MITVDALTSEALSSMLMEKEVKKKMAAEAEVKRLSIALAEAKSRGDEASIQQAQTAHDDALIRRRAAFISVTQTASMNMDVASAAGVDNENEEGEEEEGEEDEEEEEEEEDDDDDDVEAEFGDEGTDGADPVGDLMAQLKLLMSQSQIMSSIGGSISIEWPAIFIDLADVAKFAKVRRAQSLHHLCTSTAAPLRYFHRYNITS